MKMEIKKQGFEFNRDEIIKESKCVTLQLEAKIEGTALDWFWFWNQFITEIDQVQMSTISKFSYLKKLLVSKVRLWIDWLPFTSKDYTRAKQILTSRYGKPN